MRTTPLLWLALCCEEWGMPRALAERTWSALRASRWARPTALRQWLLVQPYVNPAHFRQQYTPQALVAVLEDLRQERQLNRSQCASIEETILRQVQANGRWRGDPADAGPCVPVHAPDILTLAMTGTG